MRAATAHLQIRQLPQQVVQVHLLDLLWDENVVLSQAVSRLQALVRLAHSRGGGAQELVEQLARRGPEWGQAGGPSSAQDPDS